jgi:hypothetical protein
MKAVHRGGPHDGEVTDLERGGFGTTYVEERWKRGKDGAPDTFIGSVSHKYLYHGKRERHPCKKKGTVKVLEFVETLEDTRP